MSIIVAVAPTIDNTDAGERFRINRTYIKALEKSGLIPLVVPPLEDTARAADALACASGLLLTGGIDIDPARYGRERHPKTQEPSALRDAWEVALLHSAREQELPVLAICRGMQLVNVAFGGTLVQDIASERPGSLRHDRADARRTRVHSVEIEAASRLADAIGTTELDVNSAHHQAVREIPSSLRVAALAPDGLIEGLEWGDDDWWMAGVQWHPEDLFDDEEPWDRNLFDAFARVLNEIEG